MVWSHDHSPRFSYGRDFRPRGFFSYSPMFWQDPMATARARSDSRAARVETRARAEGEAEASKNFMMVGGAILGTVAVGALVFMAAKKQ
jgi:hypothetical protein